MTVTPEQELSTIDKGDDMQRRLRYQAKYIAWKSISMLNADSEIEAFFCEHHEDLLVQLKRGGFSGIQVKTRDSHLPPFSASDAQIMSTLGRFIELDLAYPESFVGFVIATNHGFVNEQKPRSVHYLIQGSADDSDDEIAAELAAYTQRLNKELSTSFTSQNLKDILRKLTLEPALPHFPDFETVIAAAIGRQPEYSAASQDQLASAALVLSNKVHSMSSLEMSRSVEAVFKSDPTKYETEMTIANKRLTPQMVRATLKSSVIPRHIDAPTSLLVPTQISDLSTESIEEIKSTFARHSQKLLIWPTTLDGSVRLESPSLESLRSVVANQNSSVQLLLGPPGAGKSALLAKFANELQQSNYAMLAIKADQLPATVDSEGSLQSWLGLNYSLEKCVAEVAKREEVIIVFDQLDALSELVCLDPQRLIIVLKQIERLAKIENVHIVASSRTFEADYDPHLRSIEATRVCLSLPEWEQIKPVLDSRQIRHDGWTDDFRTLLRTPQYLKIFLEIHSSEPGNIFHSYRGLLNTLWRLRVESSDGAKEQLLDQIAQRMSKFEELTVPTAAFANHRSAIDQLVGSQILQEDLVGGTLTFTHQTLFEYVRARTFLKGTESLSAYVSERQNSLFVRPQLWNALKYLRDGDAGQYRTEVSSLVGNTELRFHLRLLVIEFLGQLSEPTDYEMSWVLPLLQEENTRAMVLASLVGSPGWFRKLADVFLPVFMRSSKANAKEVIGLLRSAINFDKDAVVNLLETNWLPDPQMDYQLLSVLDAMSQWCMRTVKIASTIIERTEVNSHGVDLLCSNAAKTSGRFGCELLLANLNAILERVRQIQPLKDVESIDADAKIKEESGYSDLRRDYDCPRRNAMIEFVDRDDFYIFDELVTTDPKSFVEVLWPLLIEVLGEIAHEPHAFIDTYPTDGSHTRLDDNDDVVRKYSIVGAMDDALFDFAEREPSLYCRFVEAHKHTHLQTVQRLLIRGLVKTVASEPTVSLQFLIEDNRRFCLGSSTLEHEDSVSLIEALFPHLDDDQRRVLTDKIKGYSHYVYKPQDDELKTRFERSKWDRQHRLRLMRSIPDEMAPDDLSRIRQEEERAFPNLPDEPRRGFGFSAIGSPMSIEQMTLASVDDLLSLFDELNDGTGHDHPKDFMKGGTVQLSENLIELAKVDQEKVLKLLEKFDANSNVIAATRALKGLSASGLPAESLFQLIIGLESRGFKGSQFHGVVASIIGHHADLGVKIPTEISDLLRKYLREYSGGTSEVLLSKNERSEHSLLWSSRGVDEALTESSTFTLVEALTDIYLKNDPPQWNEWLLLLEDLAQRTDLSDYVATWRLLALRPLLNLRFVDHSRAGALIESLLQSSPSPLISKTGLYLLAYTHGWLSEELVRLWLEKFYESSWLDGKQAFGELLALHYYWFPERVWTKARLDELMSTPQEADSREALSGIAYTIGHLWTSPGERDRKTDLLLSLVELPDGELCEALCEGLSSGIFPVDGQTKRLLMKLVEDRRLLLAIEPYHLVENLQELLDWFPECIYNICNALIDEFGSQIGDIRTRYAVISASLIDLVMRLQHQSEPARSWGLELFERLIDLKVHDARAMLNALDRRVDLESEATPSRPHRPRRRRQRGKKA